MKIEFNLSVVVLGMIISQGIFAAILLLANGKRAQAKRYLGLMVLAFSLWLCDAFFSYAGIYRQNPNFYFLPIYFSLGFGPLLYIYTKSLVLKKFSFERSDWLHFIAVFLQFALYVFLRLKDYTFRRWFWMEVHEPFTYNLEFNLSLVSLLVYTFLSYRLVRRYQDMISNEFSEISKFDLRWLRQLFLGISILSIAWLFEAFLRTFFNYFPDQVVLVLPMGLLVLFLAVGGLFQQNIIHGLSSVPLKAIREESKPIDQKLLERVTKKMISEKYYLDPELSLETFAKQLNLPKRQVSECINNGLQLPFIDFVNKHRVEHIKGLMQDEAYQKYSLLGLAFDSGFNSKSTFNRVFKKISGSSPSAYQKKVRPISFE